MTDESKLEQVDGGYRTRLRYGKGLRGRFVIEVDDQHEAERRDADLRRIANLLASSGHSAEAPVILRKAAAATNPKRFRETIEFAESLCGGAEQADPVRIAAASMTFRKVAEMWTSGEFARQFPDQVEDIIQDSNKQRFEKSIFPVIGDKNIRSITRRDCDEVMRRLNEFSNKGRRAGLKPIVLSRGTRRQYAGLMSRVLNLAELAGYIERSPIPKGWLPKPPDKKRFPVMYPAEDRALLACTTIPLGLRLYFGFLHREGMRRSEGARLQFQDLDLEHETVNLDRNKTNHPRFWRLYDGVAEALRLWREKRKADMEAGGLSPEAAERAIAEALVFTDENGGPIELDHLADRLRGYMQAAKIERADLYSTGELKGAFGTHSFRRGFVTRNMALDRTDEWCRARSGHTTDELLGYRVAAKSYAELDLGDVDPLVLAIPELAKCFAGTSTQGSGELVKNEHRGPQKSGGGGPRVGQKWSGRADSNRRPLDPQGGTGAQEVHEPAENKADPTPGSASESTVAQGGAQGGPGSDWSESDTLGHFDTATDPIETALADAITKASAAEQWTTVEVLASELRARREARAGVVSLDAERARRGSK